MFPIFNPFQSEISFYLYKALSIICLIFITSHFINYFISDVTFSLLVYTCIFDSLAVKYINFQQFLIYNGPKQKQMILFYRQHPHTLFLILLNCTLA